MRRLASVVLGLFAVAGPAHAILINFDDIGAVRTAPIGGFYSALGVIFSGATFQNNLGLKGSSGANGMASANANAYKWTSATPVVATFSFAVSTVSLSAVNVGENGFILNAYDAVTGGNLVGSMATPGGGDDNTGTNFFAILSVAASSIFRVEMFQNQDISIDGAFVEDFQFAAAPEPGTLALLTLGLIGGGVARRRLTKS